MSDEVEVTFTFCGGDAEPDDEHLLADIVAVDGEIIEVLAARKEGALMPLGLTDKQLTMITDAAALLPPAARDSFLRAVAAHLGGEIDDGNLLLAINAALDDLAVVVVA